MACVITAYSQGTDAPKTTNPPANPCPQVELRAPQEQIVKDGEQVGFAVVLAGGTPVSTPMIVWSTSAGSIASGQGTRNVRVDTNGAGQDRQLRVDVWVGGYPPECSVQGSTTLRVAPPASKVSEFGEIALEQENEMLKEFATALMSSNDNAYVFGYAGRNNVRGYTNATLKRIKTQLIADGIPYERIAFIDGGFREKPSIELWVVPVGADAPRATPTVNAKEIVFPKAPPAKKP